MPPKPYAASVRNHYRLQTSTMLLIIFSSISLISAQNSSSDDTAEIYIDFYNDSCEIYYNNEQFIDCEDPVIVPHEIVDNNYTISIHSDDIQLVDQTSYVFSRAIENLTFEFADSVYLGEVIQFNFSQRYGDVYLQQNSRITITNSDNSISNVHEHYIDITYGETSECRITTAISDDAVPCDDGGIEFQTVSGLQLIDENIILQLESDDTYLSTNIASIEIKHCPIGFGLVGINSSSSAWSCSQCESGSVGIRSNSKCISCHDINGVQCKGADKLIVDYNYWIHIGSTSNIFTSRCPATYCCNNITGCSYDTYSTRSLCQKNRDPDTPFCSSCLAGFSEVFGSTECKSCSEDKFGLLLYPFVTAFIFVFIVIVTDSSYGNDDERATTKKEVDLINLFIKDEVKCLKIAYIRPLVYFAQSIRYITIHTGFTYYFNPVMKFLSLDFVLISSDSSGLCFLSDLNGISKQLWGFSLVCFMFLSIFLWWIITKMIFCGGSCRNIFSFGWGVLWNIILISMSTILTKMFVLLSCRTNADGIAVHFYFAQRNCYDSIWFIAFICILCVILFWIFILYLMRKMDPTQRASSHSYLSSVTSPYKKEYYYWEIIMTARRFTIAFLVSFQYLFADEPVSECILIVVLILFLTFHVRYFPFRYQRVNVLDTACLIIFIMILSCNLLLSIGYSSVVFAVGVIVPVLCFMYFVVMFIVNGYSLKNIENRDWFKKQTIRKIDKLRSRYPEITSVFGDEPKDAFASHIDLNATLTQKETERSFNAQEIEIETVKYDQNREDPSQRTVDEIDTVDHNFGRDDKDSDSISSSVDISN